MSGYYPNNQQVQGYPSPAPTDGSGYQSPPPPGYPQQQPQYGYGDDKGQYGQQQQQYGGYPPQGQQYPPPQQYQQYPPQSSPDASGYPPQQYQQYPPQQGGYQQYPPQQQQSSGGNADFYGQQVEARTGDGTHNPHQQQYGDQQGQYGGAGGPPADGERGLGSTLLGGTAGAFIGKKIGIGKIGGAAAGAILANVIGGKKKKNKH